MLATTSFHICVCVYTHSYVVEAAVGVGIGQLHCLGEHAGITSRQDGRLPPARTHTHPQRGCDLVCGLAAHAACCTHRHVNKRKKKKKKGKWDISNLSKEGNHVCF